MTNDRSINLDILRAFAVLIVLVYHFFPSYAPWGYVGVDMFIFLSGYLLERKLASGEKVIPFLKGRVERIFPPLVIVILLLQTLGLVLLLDNELKDFVIAAFFSLIAGSNIYEASLGSYFSGYESFRPLLHLWSLSVEMQFYVLLALSYIFFRSAAFRKGFFALLIAASLLFSAFKEQTSLDYFNTLARLWEFLCGAYAFYLSRNALPKVLFWLGLTLSLACIFYIIPKVDYYPGVYPVFALAFSFCVVNISLPHLAQWSLGYPATFIASISYTLFLIHYPLLEALKLFVGQPSILDRLFVIAASFVFAWLIEGVIVRRTPILRQFKWVVLGGFLSAAYIWASYYLAAEYVRPVEAKNSLLLEDKKSFQLAPIEPCLGLGVVEERCRNYGLSPRADVVVIGDSIAHAMTPAFDVMTQQGLIEGYVQLGAGSCPPFGISPDESCNRFWAEAPLKEFLSNAKVLLITGQWPLYMGGSSDAERIASFVEKLAEVRQKYGIEVVFVSSPPLGARPKSCINRFSSEYTHQCDIPSGVTDERAQGERGLVNAISSVPGVKVISPHNELCDEQRCSVVKDGKVLYLDDSHYSVAGAESIAEWLYRESIAQLKD